MQGRFKGVVVALVIVAALSLLLISTHGKSCHYNVHVKTRLVCTKAND